MKNQQTSTKGFLTLSIAGVVNKILALAYVAIQTDLVGNVGNGIISNGYKIYIIIFSLSTAGIPTAISKLIAEQDSLGNYSNSKKILRIATIFIMFSSLILSISMAASAGFLSEQLKQPRAYLMILVLSPALLFTSISSVLRGYFQGKMYMIPTAISQVLEQFLNSVLTVVFIALFVKYGLDKAAAGSSLATVIGALGAAIFLFYSYIKFKKSDNREGSLEDNSSISNKEILKMILYYVFPAIFGILAIIASDFIDLPLVRIMIINGFTSDEANALYGQLSNQYQRILNLLLMIGASLCTVTTPAVAEAFTTKNFEVLKRKIISGFKGATFIIIPATFGLAVLAKPIITLIFFSDKRGGHEFLRMGVWVVIPMTFVYLQTSILNGIGKPRIASKNIILSLVLKLICVYTLTGIASINVKSSIIGSILSFCLAFSLNHYAITKHSKVSVNFFKLLYKPVVSSVLMAGVAYASYTLLYDNLGNIIKYNLLVNDVSVILAIGFSIITYVFVLSKLKGITSEDVIKLPMGYKIDSVFKRLRLL